jgi:hypothetical protein
MKTKTKCSICFNTLNSEFGNNAEPVNNGRCCDICNITVVIPARLNIIRSKEMTV